LNARPTILHTEASDGWGGQEIRVLSEMVGIRSRGYEVILAAPYEATIYSRAKDAGIEVFPVRMDKPGFIMGAYELTRVIRRIRVSIITTHSSRDSWMGSIAGRLTGIKVIRARHISSSLRADPLTRLVYGPLCDCVVTTGEFIKGQLMSGLGLPADKIFSVPTGVDVAKFDSADGSEVRSELNIAPDEVVIGSAAVLRSWKGHDYMVKAMPEILAEFPKARLVIAGEGPRRQKIEALTDKLGISDRVTLTGYRDDIQRVIKAFDIAVMASYASEGIPQFALQAMTARKPVVGTEIGGIPEVVIDGVTGFVVPPRDSAAIAGAVKRLAHDPELSARMGLAGRDMVMDRFTFDRMLDRLERIYKRILS